MLLAAALLASCSPPVPEPVDPRGYDSFFLWSGVEPPPYLAQARRVYLLWGEVRQEDPGKVQVLRPVPQVRVPELWLVIRAERLDWGEGVNAALLAEAERWRAAGNPVVGVQVDFDAATLKLGGYATFLRDLRARLPADFKLSATGLMDWSAGSNPADLAALNGTLDELVVQTYQGRATIPDYRRYLPTLARLELPYRVALVEQGEWDPGSDLAADPDFRGYVVFLLPR